jgi:restriction endonuclease S subunit
MSGEKGSKPRQFVIQSIQDHDRLDCHYYDPRYFETIERLEGISRRSGTELVPLQQLLANSDRRDISGGATPLGAVYLPEGVPFIRVQNVAETGIDLSGVVYIGKAVHEGLLKRSQLRPGDVLLTITGTYGISAVVPKHISIANINQHVARIAVDESKASPDYVSLYLNSEFGRNQMDRAATGGTRLALDYDSIKQILVLRPDTGAQEKIVGEVERIYQEAGRIREEISRLESSYDSVVLDKLGVRLPEEPKLKVFVAAMQGQDRMDVKWYYPYYDDAMALIETLRPKALGSYRHGLRYGASIDADYISGIPFLRIENLRPNYIDLSDLQHVSRSVYGEEVANLYLREGDILIERSGTYVGLCSYIPEGMENHVYGSYMIRLRLEEGGILPRYLSVYLNSLLGRMQFDRLKTGSLQFNINLQQIRDVRIIEPDKSTQEDIASAVFHTMDQVATLRVQYQEKLGKARARFLKLLEDTRPDRS